MDRGGTNSLRVALVHYWLATWGGGEKVLRELAGMFPQADIYSVVASEKIIRRLGASGVRTSFVQNIPGGVRWHRHFLPLYPMALEQFDLRGYDLVISSNSGPAHGVLTSTATCHISYCHSPIRYIWDLYHDYTGSREMSAVARMLFRPVAHYMRLWDVAAAGRVDFFAANSFNVARRIAKTYRRTSTVIHPPVELPRAQDLRRDRDYYLIVGRLVGYKRVDLAIEACKSADRALHVVGSGPELHRLKKWAAGAKVEFLGDASDERLAAEYAGCRALLFPGEDDFGMVPVEAQGYGRPVIAFARGGALESVIGLDPADSCWPRTATGIFFNDQTTDSLLKAIQDFESCEHGFDPQVIRDNARRFSPEVFRDAMTKFVEQCLDDHNCGTSLKGARRALAVNV